MKIVICAQKYFKMEWNRQVHYGEKVWLSHNKKKNDKQALTIVMFTLAINQVELSMHITLFDSSLYIKALDKKYFLPKFDAVNTSKVAQKLLHSQLEPTAPSNGQR